MLGSGIRRFDGDALGGRRLARTPPRHMAAVVEMTVIHIEFADQLIVVRVGGDDAFPYIATML